MRNRVVIGIGLLLAAGTVSAQQYLITTVAGGGCSAFGGPGPVATDAAGNLYFAAGGCVFRLDAWGVLARVAGSSSLPGYSGDGGVATSANFNASALVVDASGNVYIADAEKNVIRKVAAATGIITTIAGNGSSGY